MFRKHLGKIIFIAMTAVFFIFFFTFRLYTYFTYDNIASVKDFILKFSFFGPLIIFLLYMVFNIFCLPTLFFTFISGYLYGPLHGFAVAWTGMILGFMTSFYNVRYLFRKDFISRYGENKMVVKLEEYSHKYKGFAVLFFRIFFIIPYNMQNVAFALSKINPLHYLWGSSAGILPTTVFYVWLGYAFSSSIISLNDFRNMTGIFAVIFIVFGALILTGFLLKKRISGEVKKE